MKRIFYETKLIFELNPLILNIFSKNGEQTHKIEPFTSNMDQSGPDWFENVQNLVFSAHFDFFPDQRDFLWEV